MSFTNLLDTPFYSGSGGLSDQVPWPWPIAIDGRPFAIDLAHYTWDIPDMLRASFDSSDRPGEGTFEVRGVWRRVYQDWSLGAGQKYADPAKQTSVDETRQFDTSRGVDCWTAREISLLPDTEPFNTGLQGPDLLLALGDWLYMVVGGFVARTHNPEAASPTIQTVVSALGGISDITTDGATVYIATGSGIRTHASGDASPTIADHAGTAGTAACAADVLEWANGWLIAGIGGQLASIDIAGTLTNINTRPVTGWTWTAVVGAPNAIYAGGQAAGSACIYSIGIDQTTGGLAPAVYAGELPVGESLTALAYYGSVLMVGTSKGFHVAQIGAGNTLSIGPLVPTNSAVRCFAPEANFVWFGWTAYDTTFGGIGRANLGEFTDNLLPAYASDLMTVTANAVTSVARFQGRTYFGVATEGLYRPQADGSLVADATISLGRLEWGTSVAKTFLGAEIVTEPLQGSFTATLEDETGGLTPIGGRFGVQSTGRGNLLGSGLGTNSNFYGVHLALARSATDPTVGPVLRTVTARALAIPKTTRTWQLPIFAEDHVNPGEENGPIFSQDVNDIWDFFINLRNSGRPVIYQEGLKGHHLVIVRSVALPEGESRTWSSRREAVQGTLLVTLSSAED